MDVRLIGVMALGFAGGVGETSSGYEVTSNIAIIAHGKAAVNASAILVSPSIFCSSRPCTNGAF